MLKVTHVHVFLIRKVCSHTSFWCANTHINTSRSRLDRRGQSSWSVIFSWSVSVLLGHRGQVDVVSRSLWMVFIFYGGYAHAFSETYSRGKPRSMSGHMYGGCVEHV